MSATDKLVIGLSADELLVNKKFSNVLQQWSYRALWLQQFVALINPTIECECVELHDMYGPSGDRPELDVLIVSAETESGGYKVNEKRKENNIKPLELLVVTLAKSQTAADTDKISSTLIRKYIVEQYNIIESWIETQWNKLCNELCIESHIIHKYWLQLYQRYTHKPQSDLALIHMSHMLHMCIQYTDQLANNTDVMLAIFFHDYMDDTYITPTNKQTESNRNNADMFIQFCTECELDIELYHVSSATITAKHAIPLSMTASQINDMKYYLDIDSSPLSYASIVYNEYWYHVMHVITTSDLGINQQQYTIQRQQQINNLLSQDCIYETHEFRNRFEHKARYNLQQELKRLQQTNT